MKSVLAEYRIVTPLMLGGANHAPEFRLASYVHMLRWWWRFLALGRFGSAEAASFWEAVLFGWHAKPFGRKRVSFRLAKPVDGKHVAPWRGELALSNWSGVGYLTAQGFKDRPNPAKVCGFLVEARVSDRQFPDVPSFASENGNNWGRATKTLIDAMALVGLLGGLGARSRRGFGSLAISKLEVDGNPEVDGLPENIPAYEQQIKKHLGESPPPVNGPPYTAHSSDFAAHICASANNACELMNDIGWAFQIYRSWGQKRNAEHYHHLKRGDHTEQSVPAGPGKLRNKPNGWYEQKFEDDHEKFYSNLSSADHFDNRSIFGLPHNYGIVQVGWDDRNAAANTSTHNRRASPLLFHFHKLNDGKVVFVASVAKAKFTPDNARLRVGGNLKRGQDFSAVDWSLVDNFVEFIRKPPSGAGGGVHNSVIHTNYRPECGTVK